MKKNLPVIVKYIVIKQKILLTKDKNQNTKSLQ